MKPPDFLTKGFCLSANVWCEKEKAITPHLLEVVSHDNNHINIWRTCKDCEVAHARLSKLGVTLDEPRKADRLPVTEYVFLCLHPEDIIA